MRLYQGTLRQFRDDVLTNTLATTLTAAFENYYHRRPAKSEVSAWQQSFNFLANATLLGALEDNAVVVEYELPYTARRIDVLLFGRDVHAHDNVVLLELKQWSNEGVLDAEAEGNVRVKFASGLREVAHPSWQVQGYHFDRIDFLTVFQGDNSLTLSSCAFCHNYDRNNHNCGTLF